VALLGSFAAQSQLGDHKPETHGNSGEYLKGLELSPNQNDELLDRIAELHSTHRSHSSLLYLCFDVGRATKRPVRDNEMFSAERPNVVLCSKGRIFCIFVQHERHILQVTNEHLASKSQRESKYGNVFVCFVYFLLHFLK